MPALDIVFALAQSLTFVGLASMDDAEWEEDNDGDPPFERKPAMALYAGLAALSGAGAYYGFSRTGRCRDAKAELAVRRAAAFIESKQFPDGTWYGRWGCNYIYGSFLALRGLLHAGADLREGRFQKTAAWIRAHQNADGGWGELPLSYDDPSTKGHGPSTPSQTAWALVALFSTGDRDTDAVRRGIEYLLATQQYDGSWQDSHWTATGFPKVFYLRYHLYATVFPLRALALYAREGTTGVSRRAEHGETIAAAARPQHGVN